MSGRSKPYTVTEQWEIEMEGTGRRDKYESKNRDKTVDTEWQVLVSVCLPFKGHVGSSGWAKRNVALTRRHNCRKKASEEKECGPKWKWMEIYWFFYEWEVSRISFQEFSVGIQDFDLCAILKMKSRFKVTSSLEYVSKIMLADFGDWGIYTLEFLT